MSTGLLTAASAGSTYAARPASSRVDNARPGPANPNTSATRTRPRHSRSALLALVDEPGMGGEVPGRVAARHGLEESPALGGQLFAEVAAAAADRGAGQPHH